MKVWQIIGMVEADGWQLVRTRGSHRQYRHPEKRGTVTIPGTCSDDLHPKTATSIPGQAGFAPMTDYARLAESYLVLVEGGPPSNYSAWSPDLPGCAATGDTIEDGVAQMREAIAFHLEGLAEAGDAIPDPWGPGVYVARDPVPAG